MSQSAAQCDDILFEAVLADDAEAVLAHRSAEVRVFDQAAKALGQSIDIEGRVDETVDSIVHQIRLAAE